MAKAKKKLAALAAASRLTEPEEQRDIVEPGVAAVPAPAPEPTPEPALAPAPARVRIPRPRFEDGPWIALANGGVYGGAPVVGATEALRAAKHTLQGGARVVAIVSGDPAIVPEDLRERLIAVLAEIAGRR